MSTERLIIELDAQTQKLDAKLKSTDKKLDMLALSANKADKSLSAMSTTSIFAARALSAVGAVLVTGAFTRYADQIQVAENQLKSVTSSTEEYNLVQEELNRIASETRQSVNDLTSVYARFKRAGEEAGFTARDTLDLTESLTKAFKIEGNTVAEVNSVLLQLTQSFRSGRIQGEEFRAVSEGSTLVLKALADQLNVTTGDLKEMAAQGLITPEALMSGLRNADGEIKEQFAALEPTFAEAGASLSNAFAAAFKDSALEQTFSNLKRLIVDGADSMQSFFSGEESLTENELLAQLEKIQEKIRFFRAIDGINFIDQARLDYNIGQLEELEVRLAAVRDAQQDNILDVSITDGVEDNRAERELAFIEAVKEIQAERIITLDDAFQQEIEIHNEALNQKLISEKAYIKAVEDSAKKYGKAKKAEGKWATATEKEKLNAAQDGVRQAQALNQLLFDDNKAIGAGLIAADTAIAISKANALGYPMSIPAMALAAATGVAQLAALQGSSKGGGSISASGGSLSPPQDNYIPDQSEIGLDFRDETGSTSNTITFNAETGDQLIDVLAGMLNENQRQGRG